jgi:dienelactone hydrolase
MDLSLVLTRRVPAGQRAPAHAACGFALLALCGLSRVPAAQLVTTQIIEETIAVPVELRAPNGAVVHQTIAVRITREAATRRRPFLVLHHGRGADPTERTALGLATYSANARYFASRGFVVMVPTRVGYGVSGGPDVEYTGECAYKRFADGVAVAVSETRQLLRYAAQFPYVDAGHGIVVGESFGGLVAVAVASSDIPGVVATINFSGGDGGDLRRHVDRPCRPDQMSETLARYGKANRLPTLWLYSANDRVWGPVYPQRWFAAFVAAGGQGQFVALPADKNNGHYIFNRNPVAWQPPFEKFAAGLPLP